MMKHNTILLLLFFFFSNKYINFTTYNHITNKLPYIQSAAILSQRELSLRYFVQFFSRPLFHLYGERRGGGNVAKFDPNSKFFKFPIWHNLTFN